MPEPATSGQRRQITPRDVFQRANMPSRWERLTGVSPKTAPDRKYLAFVSARYRGDERLPHPAALDIPAHVRLRQRMHQGGSGLAALAFVLAVTGLGTGMSTLVVVAAGILGLLAVVGIVGQNITESETQRFRALRARAELAEARLHADSLDSEDAATLNRMITCDEGTLTYCAAKIASEIEQEPAWNGSSTGFVPIDLWDELAEIAGSARQIARDREESEDLERGRLRDDPEIRAVIDEEKQQRAEAIAALTARVHAFADYRDRVQRHGALVRREQGAVDRVVRKVIDEQAGDRFR